VIKSVIRLYGVPPERQEEAGLLDQLGDEVQTCYSFWVVASPGLTCNSGTASILPITSDSIDLRDISKHHHDMSGGEAAAYAKAIEFLKSHDSLSGLRFFEHKEP
jgi:hypothetical protein